MAQTTPTPSPGLNPSMRLSICEAIARYEGFYKARSRPNRNNNPGDLEFHDWQKQFGAVLEKARNPRFAVFPSVEQGFAALKHLFGFPLYKGQSIRGLIAKFAPSNENDTKAYIEYVCTMTGLDADTIIDDHL